MINKVVDFFFVEHTSIPYLFNTRLQDINNIMSSDFHVQVDLMNALIAFTNNEHQLRSWNGFAIYCMEIAVGFINTYKTEMGSAPPGIQQDALDQKQMESSRSLTMRQIKEFVNGTRVNADLQTLLTHFKGTQNRHVTTANTASTAAQNALTAETAAKIQAQNDLAVAQREIARINVELTAARNDLVTARQSQGALNTSLTAQIKRLEDAFNSMKASHDSAMSDMARSQSSSMGKIDLIKQSIERSEAKKIEVNQRFLTELESMRSSSAIPVIQTRIQTLIDMIKGSTEITNSTLIVQNLQSEIQRRDTEITQKQTEIAQKDSQLSRLAADNQRISSENTQLQNDISSLQVQNAQLQAQLRNANSTPSPEASAGAALLHAGSGASGAPVATVFSADTLKIAEAELRRIENIISDVKVTDNSLDKSQKISKTSTVFEFMGTAASNSMLYILEFVWKSHCFHMALRRFHVTFASQGILKAYSETKEELKKRIPEDGIYHEFFDSVLGFGNKSSFISYGRQMAKEMHVNAIEKPCLMLEKLTSSMPWDMKLELRSSNEFESTLKFASFAHYEQYIRRSLDVEYHCLILHLYRLLRISMNGGKLNSTLIEKFLVPRITGSLNLKDSTLLQALPHRDEFVNVCIHKEQRGFPYFLFHSGLYANELLERYDRDKMLVCKRDRDQPQLYCQGFRNFSIGIMRYIASFPHTTENFLENFIPCD